MKRVYMRCTGCGARGRSPDPTGYLCLTCRSSDELTGGRWVQDGWVQRWVPDEVAS